MGQGPEKRLLVISIWFHLAEPIQQHKRLRCEADRLFGLEVQVVLELRKILLEFLELLLEFPSHLLGPLFEFGRQTTRQTLLCNRSSLLRLRA